jgi:hypothetical protein
MNFKKSKSFLKKIKFHDRMAVRPVKERAWQPGKAAESPWLFQDREE